MAKIVKLFKAKSTPTFSMDSFDFASSSTAEEWINRLKKGAALKSTATTTVIVEKKFTSSTKFDMALHTVTLDKQELFLIFKTQKQEKIGTNYYHISDM